MPVAHTRRRRGGGGWVGQATQSVPQWQACCLEPRATHGGSCYDPLCMLSCPSPLRPSPPPPIPRSPSRPASAPATSATSASTLPHAPELVEDAAESGLGAHAPQQRAAAVQAERHRAHTARAVAPHLTAAAPRAEEEQAGSENRGSKVRALYYSRSRHIGSCARTCCPPSPAPPLRGDTAACPTPPQRLLLLLLLPSPPTRLHESRPPLPDSMCPY